MQQHVPIPVVAGLVEHHFLPSILVEIARIEHCQTKANEVNHAIPQQKPG